MIKYALYIPLVFFLLISCESSEEKELKSLISSVQESEVQTSVSLDDAKLLGYKDVELKMNEQYIEELKQLIENNFENQLNQFDDKELGFFATYKKMFKVLTIWSNKRWEKYQQRLSDKYFNNNQLKEAINTLSQSHLNDVKTLRTQFYTSTFDEKTLVVDIDKLHISESNIYIQGLREYSANNVLLEISPEPLRWLFAIFIGWLLTTIFGVESKSFAISLIAIIFALAISLIIAYINDEKILDSIRKQEPKIQIDYDAIKQEIDNNTIDFYESVK